MTLIQQSLLRKAFARALGVIKEGISASRKGKFKEETERLDIQAEEIILPQSEDKSMSFMDFSKTFVELHEATARIEVRRSESLALHAKDDVRRYGGDNDGVNREIREMYGDGQAM